MHIVYMLYYLRTIVFRCSRCCSYNKPVGVGEW